MSQATSSLLASPLFLRRILQADAASCVATGAVQLAAAPALAGLLGLPQPLLVVTGAFLLAYAAAVLWLSLRLSIPRAPVGMIIVGNVLWAVCCAWLVAAGPFPPTMLGQAWVLAQAAVVAVLAELQWMALRAGRC